MADHPEEFLEYSDWMGIPIQPYAITLDRIKALLSAQAALLESSGSGEALLSYDMDMDLIFRPPALHVDSGAQGGRGQPQMLKKGSKDRTREKADGSQPASKGDSGQQESHKSGLLKRCLDWIARGADASGTRWCPT